MWSTWVDLIRATIFGAAHACGGSLGGAILLVSFLVRMAFLPVMLRMARRARETQAKLVTLKPELDRISKRYANEPAELFRRTRALHQRHGIRFFDGTSLLILAAQVPLLGGLFSAVRTGLGAGTPFLWIGNLARPDGLALLLIAAMSTGAAFLGPRVAGQPDIGAIVALVAGVSVLFFLSATSSAVALSVGAGSAVTAIQNLILRREAALGKS